MISRGRKRLTVELRRARIFSAAVQEFAREGYDRAKMDGIAARADITKPVLYDHFFSKQALFLAVLELIRDGLIERGEAIAREDTDPEQKFRQAVDTFLKFVEQFPDAARVLLMVPIGDPVAAQLSQQVQAGATAGIAGLLVDFLPDRTSWRLQGTAEFLKEGLHAVAIWWLDHPGPSRKDLVDLVTHIAWFGLLTGVRKP